MRSLKDLGNVGVYMDSIDGKYTCNIVDKEEMEVAIEAKDIEAVRKIFYRIKKEVEDEMISHDDTIRKFIKNEAFCKESGIGDLIECSQQCWAMTFSDREDQQFRATHIYIPLVEYFINLGRFSEEISEEFCK